MCMVVSCSFMIPVLMTIVGCIFKKRAPKKINAIWGYRTFMSMLNVDTWEFAHMCLGKVWYKCGWISLVLSLALIMVIYIIEKELMEMLSIIIIIMQCIMIFVTVLGVEIKLKENFDKEGKRK